MRNKKYLTWKRAVWVSIFLFLAFKEEYMWFLLAYRFECWNISAFDPVLACWAFVIDCCSYHVQSNIIMIICCVKVCVPTIHICAYCCWMLFVGLKEIWTHQKHQKVSFSINISKLFNFNAPWDCWIFFKGFWWIKTKKKSLKPSGHVKEFLHFFLEGNFESPQAFWIKFSINFSVPLSLKKISYLFPSAVWFIWFLAQLMNDIPSLPTGTLLNYWPSSQFD